LLSARRPPSSTHFPYTTLFRSCSPRSRSTREEGRARRGRRGFLAVRRGRWRGWGKETAGGTADSRWPARAPHVPGDAAHPAEARSEEHTSELQSRENLVCRLLL